jgi:hypothetical protein
VRPAPGKHVRSSVRKITKAKNTGSVVQVVDCLPSKSEALSSNPSIAKNQI